MDGNKLKDEPSGNNNNFLYSFSPFLSCVSVQYVLFFSPSLLWNTTRYIIISQTVFVRGNWIRFARFLKANVARVYSRHISSCLTLFGSASHLCVPAIKHRKWGEA